MRQLPSRHRRLDGALADLPVEEPMLLSELDGYLTALAVGPDDVPAGEWMTAIWGPDDPAVPPFEDPLDVQWFVDAVAARRGEIARDLDRGRIQPIFDIDERSGERLWDYWIAGFAEAMALRPEAWTPAEGDVGPTAAALARIGLLIAVAREESTLDSMEINAVADRAPEYLIADVQCLHDARRRSAGAPVSPATPGKIGRNDPCGCGSGRKSKRCCG